MSRLAHSRRNKRLKIDEATARRCTSKARRPNAIPSRQREGVKKREGHLDTPSPISHSTKIMTAPSSPPSGQVMPCFPVCFGGSGRPVRTQGTPRRRALPPSVTLPPMTFFSLSVVVKIPRCSPSLRPNRVSDYFQFGQFGVLLCACVSTVFTIVARSFAGGLSMSALEVLGLLSQAGWVGVAMLFLHSQQKSIGACLSACASRIRRPRK